VKKSLRNIIILAIFSVAIFFIVPQNLATIGYSTISLQQVKLLSSDEFFKNTTWSLITVIDGSSGYAEFLPDSLGNLELSGQKPNQKFKLKIELVNQSCKWLMKEDSKQAYSIRTWVGHDGWNNNCPQGTYTPSSSICGAYGGSPDYDCCYNAYFNGEGYVHELDSSVIYNYDIKISIETEDGKITELKLSPQEKEAYNEFIRAKMLGGLIGTQSCPTASSEVVIYRQDSSYSLKNRYIWNTLYGQQLGLSSISARWSNTGSYNTVYNEFINSNPELSKICTVNKIDSKTTALECTPTASVQVPLIQLYINANLIGVHIPSGQPKILEVNVPQTIQASKLTTIQTKVKNLDNEQDTFSVKVLCTEDYNPFSQEYNFNSLETKTVDINLQGQGVIRNCELKVNSVNSPDKEDSAKVRVLFEPFCDKTTPSIAHMKVATEYGCQFICPNQYKQDVLDYNCQEITLEMLNENFYKTNYEELKNKYECIGEGKYISSYGYLKLLSKGELEPFIPKQINNLVWLQAPYCKYIAEYGFNYDSSTYTVNQITENYDYVEKQIENGEFIDITKEPTEEQIEEVIKEQEQSQPPEVIEQPEEEPQVEIQEKEIKEDYLKYLEDVRLWMTLVIFILGTIYLNRKRFNL
jgi:hypothetical protein